MKYKIEVSLEKGQTTATINGKKFHLEGHRWKDEKDGSAQNYAEPIKDLIAAIARYEKIHTRLEGQTVTPVLETSAPTVTPIIETTSAQEPLENEH